MDGLRRNAASVRSQEGHSCKHHQQSFQILTLDSRLLRTCYVVVHLPATHELLVTWLAGSLTVVQLRRTSGPRTAGRARADGASRTASDGLRCPQRSTTGTTQTPWRQRTTDTGQRHSHALAVVDATRASGAPEAAARAAGAPRSVAQRVCVRVSHFFSAVQTGHLIPG